MKRLLNILALLCAFGFTTASISQSAPTIEENTSIAQGTLMEIKSSLYVIINHTGEEQCIHVDKSTIIIGKIQPKVRVKAQMNKDGHASAVMITES